MSITAAMLTPVQEGREALGAREERQQVAEKISSSQLGRSCLMSSTVCSVLLLMICTGWGQLAGETH